jgi:TRAP-type C4-dicarboxylate transport system permease small subunit
MASNQSKDEGRRPEILETVDLETGQSISQKRTLLGSRVLLIFCSIFLLSTMMIVVVNVVGRALFQSPLWGAVEMIGILGVIIIPTALCYTELAKGHITVDILVSRMSGKVRKSFSIAAYILGVICIVLLLIGAFKQVTYIAVTPGSNTPDLSIPILPLKIIWFVECIIFGGCLAWNFVQTIVRRPNR